MMAHASILIYRQGTRGWWARLMVEVPEDVERRLAIAKTAHGIANQLAPLEPEANREILYQAAALLGVLNEKER